MKNEYKVFRACFVGRAESEHVDFRFLVSEDMSITVMSSRDKLKIVSWPGLAKHSGGGTYSEALQEVRTPEAFKSRSGD
jgi:hypothetical protein